MFTMCCKTPDLYNLNILILFKVLVLYNLCINAIQKYSSRDNKQTTYLVFTGTKMV